MRKEHSDSLSCYLKWAMDDYQDKLTVLLESLKGMDLSELKNYFDMIKELCQISIDPEKINRGLEIANNILTIWQEYKPIIEADIEEFSSSCHEGCTHDFFEPVVPVNNRRRNLFF